MLDQSWAEVAALTRRRTGRGEYLQMLRPTDSGLSVGLTRAPSNKKRTDERFFP